jgi:N-acetyl-gamma-glutamyl-phosphate reductase/acetylglutamate kinase
MQVAFIPSVAPFFSGILSTLSFPLSTSKLGASDIASLYAAYYTGERLVRVQKAVPALDDVQGQHGWVVGGVQVHSGRERVVVVGGLDNLLKGAATQCLQVGVYLFSVYFLPFFLSSDDTGTHTFSKIESEPGAWI